MFGDDTVHGASDAIKASAQDVPSASAPLSLSEQSARTAQLSKSPLASASGRVTFGGASYSEASRSSQQHHQQQRLSDFMPPLPVPLTSDDASAAGQDDGTTDGKSAGAKAARPPRPSSANSMYNRASAPLQRTSVRHALRQPAAGDGVGPYGVSAHRRIDTASELARGHGIMQPVASWGSFSLQASSPASSPSASYVNLSALARAVVPRGQEDSVHSREGKLRGRAQAAVHDNGDEEEELALTTSEVAAATAVSLAMNSHAKLLLVVTDSGHTVAIAAKYKPRMPIVSLIVPRVTLTSNMTWRVKVLDSNNLSTAVPVLVRAHAVT